MSNTNFPYQLSVPTDAEAEVINDKMDAFNGEQVSFTGKVELFINYIIKNNDEVIAGIRSVFYLGSCLVINVLFVDEKYRLHKLGTTLLEKVEMDAKNMGGQLSHLDTFDFQAKDFYLKHGYEIFGTLTDCPKGHTRFYMKKVL